MKKSEIRQMIREEIKLLTEAKIKYVRGKKISGDTIKYNWQVTWMGKHASIAINVSNSGGWSTNVHNPDEIKLMSNGRLLASVYWKEGNIDSFASRMHSIAEKEDGSNYLTKEQYADVLRVAIDMEMYMRNKK